MTWLEKHGKYVGKQLFVVNSQQKIGWSKVKWSKELKSDEFHFEDKFVEQWPILSYVIGLCVFDINSGRIC